MGGIVYVGLENSIIENAVEDIQKANRFDHLMKRSENFGLGVSVSHILFVQLQAQRYHGKQSYRKRLDHITHTVYVRYKTNFVFPCKQ